MALNVLNGIPIPHAPHLLLILLTIYILYRTVRRLALWRRHSTFAAQHGCLPPTRLPQWDPIYGIDVFRSNLRALKNHTILDKNRARFTSTNSNTVSFITLGRHLISTIEPENLKTILAVDFKKWTLTTRRKIAFRPLLGEGIFTTDGHAWANSRSLLRPNFARDQVGDMDLYETHVSNLIAALPPDGTTVDLADFFFRLTIDSATEFLFGQSTHALLDNSEDRFAGAFTRSQEYIARNTTTGMLVRYFAPSTSDAQFAKDRDFVHAFVDSYVHARLAAKSAGHLDTPTSPSSSSSSRYLFIDELVRQTSDPIQIRSELLNILLAGRDTTASLLTNVFHALSTHPHIWTTLRDEVTTQLPSPQKPTFASLKNLRYLKALLNESLRLHPVVPINSRQATVDTTLPLGGGPDGQSPLFIPAGQTVTYSVHAMHRRTDLYGPDAEVFNPARWLDDPVSGKKGLRPSWEYLPFNGGPRICLGQQFALTEAAYTVARMCQVFQTLEARDHRPWTEMLTLTCVNRYGARVALRRRSQ